MNITVRIGAANHKFVTETGLIPDTVYLGFREYSELCSVLECTKVEQYLGLNIIQVYDTAHINVNKYVGE